MEGTAHLETATVSFRVEMDESEVRIATTVEGGEFVGGVCGNDLLTCHLLHNVSLI